MKAVLLYIWQLPQHLVALAILLWASCFKRIRHKVIPDYGDGQSIYYLERFSGGISLGEYIFLNAYYEYRDGTTEHHELGHCKQSRMLGWLYLLVIGIPSIIWAACYQFDKSDPNGYYRFYTESWADKLGGVKREG